MVQSLVWSQIWMIIVRFQYEPNPAYQVVFPFTEPNNYVPILHSWQSRSKSRARLSYLQDRATPYSGYTTSACGSAYPQNSSTGLGRADKVCWKRRGGRKGKNLARRGLVARVKMYGPTRDATGHDNEPGKWSGTRD